MGTEQPAVTEGTQKTARRQREAQIFHLWFLSLSVTVCLFIAAYTCLVTQISSLDLETQLMVIKLGRERVNRVSDFIVCLK